MTGEDDVIFRYGLSVVIGLVSGVAAFILSSKFIGSSNGAERKTGSTNGGPDEKVSKNEDAVFSFAETVGETKMVLVVRNDLKMGKGKAAAQCSHAAVMAHEMASKKQPDVLKKWRNSGQRKIVVKAESEAELFSIAAKAKNEGLIYAIVKDAGLTQVVSGTVTVLAVGPGDHARIDKLTGHLKLY